MVKNPSGSCADAARGYIAAGLAPIPIPQGKKEPQRNGWQNAKWGLEDVPELWDNGQNIGILMGDPSGGVVCVDLDRPEALAVADWLLPKTRTGGRGGRPRGHRFYLVEGAPVKTKRYTLPGQGAERRMLEVLSTGTQVLVEPSSHPSGERYTKDEHPITAINAGEFLERVEDVALASALAYHYPGLGARHDYILAATGYLGRHLSSGERVERIMEAVIHASGDEEADARRRDVEDTLEKLARDDEKVTGGPKLDGIAPGILGVIRDWTNLVDVVSRNGSGSFKASKKKSEDDPGPTKRLSDAICEGNHFAQDSGGKLYRYSKGAYRKAAEKYIRRRVKELLEEWGESALWSSYRGDEVVKYIAADAPELWERPPFDEINVENGILNVYSRELRDHSPDYLSPVQIPITYDPDARCKAWEQYVEPCFPNDAPSLPYEIFASVITPYKATQKAVLLLGEGANGKSTYLAAIMRALGRANCTSVTLQALETNRFATARLIGKLANVCADLPSTHLTETSVFKALTGDEGQITAEYKHRDSFEFEPYCQLVFSANHPPKSSDASHAFYRRWVVAPFDRTFDEDDAETMGREELDAILAAPGELSGMLNKALDALPGLRKNGFTESPKMRDAWEEFRAMTDPVSVWLSRKVVRGPNAYVVKEELHKAYNEHAERHGQTLTVKAFSQGLKRAMPEVGEGQRSISGVRKHCWLGIGFKTGDEPPPGPGVSYEDYSTPAQGAQGAQDYSICNEKADNPLNEGNDSINVGGSGHLCNKGNPVHPVHPVQEFIDASIEALTYGNGPKKALENFRKGSQDLESVVKSVMFYRGRRDDDIERWREPVERAIELLDEEEGI